MSRIRTPARMTRLVTRWRASGESGRASRGAITFPYGRSGIGAKLAAEPRTEAMAPPPATFIPVRVAADTDAPEIEIVWSGGERLHIRPGTSAELVRAVVAALRSPC